MSTETKDFGLHVRVFNNQLRSRQRESALILPELCKAIGISLQSWYQLVSLKLSPLGQNGWREIALKIADYFGELPEDLFPNAGQAFRQRVSTLYFDANDIAALGVSQPRGYLPSDPVAAEERLRPRDEKIVRMRFGIGSGVEHDLESVGERFDLSRERVRQIEVKAMRKMKIMEEQTALREHWDTTNEDKEWTP